MRLLDGARGWWRTLAARDRALLVFMVVFLVAALAWFAGIAPAWRTVRTAPAQIAALDSQWAAMQALAAEARGMHSRGTVDRQQALRELEAAVRQRLGSAGQVTAGADRVTVVLRGAAPPAMAPWLSQVRLQARLVARQANLTRGPTGWDGTVVFSLPPAP